MPKQDKRHHLIVLVHGLWGSSQNMARLESVIHHSLDDSKICTIHTYSPSCFSHFKTYDGVEAIGDYIIPDLFNHIETLHNKHGVIINEISFIGYSLGGLVVRYIIGELFDAGFFNTIIPVFFTTFATPHLGITFYTNKFINHLGSNLLGQTGMDLFLTEGRDGILYKLSEPKGNYYQGLSLFKSKICIANAKFDRSVGFYSAFITKYDVFNDWENINPKFIEDLPTATIDENGKLIECLIIDFNKTEKILKEDDILDPPKTHSTHKSTMFFIGSFVVLLFPIIFSLSALASIKSFFRNRILQKPDTPKLWKRLFKLIYSCNDTHIEDSDDYNEEENLKSNPIGLSHITRNFVEDGLTMMETNNDIDEIENLEDNELERIISSTTIDKEINESYFIDLNFELNYSSKKSVIKKLKDNLKNGDLSDLKLVENLDPLPFNDVREEVLNNLNTIDWKKITVLLLNLNSHQSVVGRRGFERTPDCIPFLFLYSFLIETGLKTI